MDVLEAMRRLVRTVVEVTPSYIGTLPAAILVVCTDVELAEEQMGRQGREHLSRIDAGAASEHIALAAVELGLGCYLFRASNESALRAVLDLPPRVMVDAVERLIAGVFDDDFLRELKPELEREKQKVMSDRDAFVAWLDDLAARFAAEARRRNLAEVPA